MKIIQADVFRDGGSLQLLLRCDQEDLTIFMEKGGPLLGDYSNSPVLRRGRYVDLCELTWDQLQEIIESAEIDFSLCPLHAKLAKHFKTTSNVTHIPEIMDYCINAFESVKNLVNRKRSQNS